MATTPPRSGLQKKVREHSAFYDAGSINFKLRRKTAKAQFIRVPRAVAPQMLSKEINRLWQLGHVKPPGLVLRVTGARGGELSDDVVESLEGGVVHAAGLSGAWTFTNGLDCGVANIVGYAHMKMQHRWNGPLVGIAQWGATQGREQLLRTHIAEQSGSVLQRRLELKPSKREYKESPPESGTVCLEPNHTHFVVVGGPPPPQQQASAAGMIAWTAQAAVADAHGHGRDHAGVGTGATAQPLSVIDGVECAIAREHGCGRVLLVCGGGEEVLHELLAFLRADATSMAIMLEDDKPQGDGSLAELRDDNGSPSRLSDAVKRFLLGGKVPPAWRRHQALFDELKTFGFESSKRGINDGVYGRIMVCTAEETSSGEASALGESILKAVLHQVLRRPASQTMATLCAGPASARAAALWTALWAPPGTATAAHARTRTHPTHAHRHPFDT